MVNIEDYILKDKDVELSSGQKSTTYYELRAIATHTCNDLRDMLDLLHEKIWTRSRTPGYKIVIGQEFGGALFTTGLLARHEGYINFILRKEKQHGNTERLIHPPTLRLEDVKVLCNVYEVIYIDDVCTSAKTLDDGQEYLASLKISVDRIIVLKNRGNRKMSNDILLEEIFP